RGEVIVIRSGRADAGDATVPRSRDADILPSSLAAPLLAEDETTGWLTLESVDDKRSIDAAEITLAQRLAGVIALGRTRAEAERALRRAKEEAVAANLAKRAFLASMSHELRTPLNGVIGMVDLLATTVLSGEQRRYVEMARTSAGLLLSVINDI